MRKLGLTFMIMGIVVAAYIVMMVMQPTVNEIVQTVNTTANWAGHEDYKYTQAVLLGWRWWAWLVPGVLGVATEVIMLKTAGRNR